MKHTHTDPPARLTRFRRFSSLLLLSALLVIGTNGPALCAETDSEAYDDFILEDTVVTATKRAERAQDIPQSITTFSADDLSFMGAQNFNDMVDSVPGVELRNTQAGQGQVTMRGVSEMSVVNGGPGASVGYYLDELPLTMAGFFPDVASFDMARVEVMRGPQGTLFGEGSMAGTIRMIANKPDSTGFDNYVELSYSDTENGADNYAANAMVNLPLIKDKMAVRLVAIANDNGGFIDQTDPSTGAVIAENINDSESLGGRMALRFTPSDKLTMDAAVLYSKIEAGRRNVATDAMTFSSHVTVPDFHDDDLLGLNLTIQYDLSFADLISSTSFFDREFKGPMDVWFTIGDVTLLNTMVSFFLTGVPGMTGPPGFGLPTWITPDGVYYDQILESEAISQELRLVSKGDGPWQWVVGAFYKKQKQHFLLDANTKPAMDPGYLATLAMVFGSDIAFLSDSNGNYEQYAGFGELSYDFSEKFTITVGGRAFKEERDTSLTSDGFFLTANGMMPGTLNSSGESTVFNPKLLIRYKFTNDLMCYAQYSEGFRSGGQNVFPVANVPVSYDPETLTNYEIGLKSTFWDGRARLNVAVYHMAWNDLQADLGIGVATMNAIDNVGDAHSTGIDVEFFLRPVNGLTWTIGGTSLEAETDDDYIIAGSTVPSGTKVPKSAEVMFNTALQYNFLLTENLWGFARASYSYTGTAANGLGSDVEIPAYEIVNFRAGVERENWQLTVFVDNALDEQINLGNVTGTTDLFSGDSINVYGYPRTIGVSLKFNF
ncbi:MAG: TonB-dependent receptor [Deltaproteobacteria bacterium]|nr:TonB-dependent receptor [Deltaproteobacteria bacterium]